MNGKIALEEHFMCPGFEEYWLGTIADVDPAIVDLLTKRLNDFGELRLGAMDRAGISRAVLSLAGPGVQAEKDTAVAVRKAKQANDFLAETIAKNPNRYLGFAHLAVQDARAAADELDRCVKQLKFVGAMINGHTNGQYLDDPALYPLWERAEALGVPIYIHPADPGTLAPVLDGHKALRRATWEWGFETGSHALRLVFSGLFDRFPNAKVVLGHLGETLPYLLWRFDSRAKLYGVKLDRAPSEYIRANIAVTFSGMFSAEPLACALAALGSDRVMFGSDFPFESSEEAAAFLASAPISDDVRTAIAAGNARLYFGL